MTAQFLIGKGSNPNITRVWFVLPDGTRHELPALIHVGLDVALDQPPVLTIKTVAQIATVPFEDPPTY